MSVLIVRAADLAARAHAGQRRKGEGDVPYVNHCTAVACLVAGVTDYAETIAAALLHDTVEDSEVTLDQLSAEFGPRVAELVACVTDSAEVTSLALSERKAAQAEKMRSAPDAAKLIKIADQTSNLRDIVAMPPDWSTARKQAYLDGARMVVDACRGVSESLETAFDEAAARLAASLQLTPRAATAAP